MAQEFESLALFLAVMERDVPGLVSLVQSHRTLTASQSVSRSQPDSETAVSVCARASEGGKYFQKRVGTESWVVTSRGIERSVTDCALDCVDSMRDGTHCQFWETA